MAGFEAEGDDDSRALLLAWLERHGPDSGPGCGPGPDRDTGPAPPPPDPARMTDAEAYRVLGLAPGASPRRYAPPTAG